MICDTIACDSVKKLFVTGEIVQVMYSKYTTVYAYLLVH
jgi:hypothetical protein